MNASFSERFLSFRSSRVSRNQSRCLASELGVAQKSGNLWWYNFDPYNCGHVRLTWLSLLSMAVAVSCKACGHGWQENMSARREAVGHKSCGGKTQFFKPCRLAKGDAVGRPLWLPRRFPCSFPRPLEGLTRTNANPAKR